MGEALGILYLLLFLFAGLVYASFLRSALRPLPRAMLGLTFGLFLLIWLPALFSFLLGFGPASQLLALAVCILPAFALCLAKKCRPADLSVPADKELAALLCISVPLFLLCAWLLYTHVLRPENGALHTGQSCFGDMAMHLSFITSIQRSGVFPPLYSIQAGTPMGYPFLCDSVSSTFLTLGASLRFAYILPMLPALFLVFGWYYLLLRRMLSSRRGALLGCALFFLGGGFGFAYFFEGAGADPDVFYRLFFSFYETPANLVSENIRWVNPICDMLIPQRATLFGWAVLLPCLYLLLQASDGDKLSLYLPLGILAGGLPLLHTHSFLALFLISAPLCLWKWIRNPISRKGFALYAALCCALALPQLLLFTLRQASGAGFLRFHFNWINEEDPFLWFYIKNWGLVFVLLPFALLNAKGRRGLFLCSLPVWLVSELFLFQPNAYDNNKLLFIVYMLACGLAADFLCTLYDKLNGLKGRRLLAGCVVFLLLLSGSLSILREIVSDYELFSAEQVESAHLASSLPKDAVLLTADEHNNAFASLSGLTIVQGSPSYLYFHGVYDEERARDVAAMYTQKGALASLAKKYGVTHVVLSDYERALGADESIFEELPPVFSVGSTCVYALE